MPDYNARLPKKAPSRSNSPLVNVFSKAISNPIADRSFIT
jgi:hypothetical protein